ncbi:hypothetical protein [Paenibacillus methanolicus]|uniref:Uncharacterized protein n=1 Tax=Paenibacillus methanolicus TaxID=582686 RepID=A0A5S5CIC9_9BACL|nr:hypothetical protein [Paenibacillus methanolicus]TYP79549.1 hypothetical protein BCM02_101668 [Paenibacillus methanolicus]
MENEKNEAKFKLSEMEHELAEQLENGPMNAESDRDERARVKLPAKYEMRVQTEHDPVAEETKLFRSMAREVDARYDKYAAPNNEESTGDK